MALDKEDTGDSPRDQHTFSLLEISDGKGTVKRRAGEIIKQLDVSLKLGFSPQKQVERYA